MTLLAAGTRPRVLRPGFTVRIQQTHAYRPADLAAPGDGRVPAKAYANRHSRALACRQFCRLSRWGRIIYFPGT
jgi:hypothetical protein